jgi:tRNA threonylcarbamoyladenosine biosynthesis protein TsaB
MAYVLNIETATRNCSVSVSRDGKTLSLVETAGEGYAHAEKLHVYIERSLREAAVAYRDLQAVSVSKGPGSYTGLRIGVSAAKGLCYALKIPLMAIDTLEILAMKIDVGEGLIIPMIDARRMEAYTAVFDARHRPVRGVEAEILDENSFSQWNGPLHIGGDCQDKLEGILKRDDVVFHGDAVFPSAGEMASVAQRKFSERSFVDVAYFEPFYLKDFIAGKSK